MSTFIIAAIIFILFALVIYNKFFKKNASGSCHDCVDIGCPLADQSKMLRNKKSHH
ncbi:FeoB-associated Cys-rich membrane protein [Leuconostoc mesenteroides]|uniref:FeoB-associated Cys-rich membrane protein n=1 Tax=Leuconostoc mesenteroides TaxID=1245 RepID=A0A843Z0E6_LEUME|nr:FeoB-associated Cys-rich membrane protein [Leuconostoc mesenteroides]RDG13136.1 FeoB-associated Cys-rich membrane protein [Leuconostoc mesenteroides subsp. mesenteroides]